MFDFTSTTFRVLSWRQLDIAKARSRDFYDEFIELKLEAPVSCYQWRIDCNIQEEVIYNSLILANWCTLEPNLVAIQFKMIHHDIVNYNTIGLFFTIYPLRPERVLFSYKVHEAADCDAAIGSAN